MSRQAIRVASLRARAKERPSGAPFFNRSLLARPSSAAGRSWRKFEGGLDPRFPVRPWHAFWAGRIGLALILGSVVLLASWFLR